MSITSDLRAYAEKAAGTAQAQLNDVTGTANKYVGTARDNVQSVADKASEAVNDLFASAEKAVNLDAIKSAVEPYLAQAKQYGTAVSDRAEALLTELKKKDPRVAKLIETAEATATSVVSTVQQRVVTPLTRSTSAKPAAKSGPRPSTKTAQSAKRPAATKPASRPAAKSTTARKAPAKRATTSTSTSTPKA